jgi:hypothetical protein
MRGDDIQIAYGLNKKRISCAKQRCPLTQVMVAPDTPEDYLERQTSAKRLRMVSVAGEGLMERISDNVVRQRR